MENSPTNGLISVHWRSPEAEALLKKFRMPKYLWTAQKTSRFRELVVYKIAQLMGHIVAGEEKHAKPSISQFFSSQTVSSGTTRCTRWLRYCVEKTSQNSFCTTMTSPAIDYLLIVKLYFRFKDVFLVKLSFS